jgi:hypothetical protein
MMHRIVTCALALLATIAGASGAQLSYEHTDFLHGYASSGNIWTQRSPWLGYSPSDYLALRVAIKTPHYPTFDSKTRLTVWRDQYSNLLAGVGGGHASVGHSTGALLARSTYMFAPNGRSHIRGIVAVAAPHQGTHLADSAEKLRNFYVDVQRRIDDVERALGIFHVLLRLSTYSMGALGVGGAIFGELLYEVIGRATQFDPVNLDMAKFVPIEEAIHDLKPASANVSQLNSNVADAAIPRANVTARIPLKNAALKVAAAGLGVEEAEIINTVNKGKRKLRKCKRVLWMTIIGIHASVVCGRAEALLKRVDDTYGRYVNGSQRRCFLGGLCANVARDVPFDGVVSSERQVYPGLSDPSLNLLPVDGLNHQNIYKKPVGADRIAQAMRAIGMAAANVAPLSGGVSGPTAVGLNYTCTWYASVSGGTPPYSYVWSVNGSQGYSYSSSMTYRAPWYSTTLTIGLSVRDQGGRSLSATKTVYVASGPTCY